MATPKSVMEETKTKAEKKQKAPTGAEESKAKRQKKNEGRLLVTRATEGKIVSVPAGFLERPDVAPLELKYKELKKQRKDQDTNMLNFFNIPLTFPRVSGDENDSISCIEDGQGLMGAMDWCISAYAPPKDGEDPDELNDAMLIRLAACARTCVTVFEQAMKKRKEWEKLRHDMFETNEKIVDIDKQVYAIYVKLVKLIGSTMRLEDAVNVPV